MSFTNLTYPVLSLAPAFFFTNTIFSFLSFTRSPSVSFFFLTGHHLLLPFFAPSEPDSPAPPFNYLITAREVASISGKAEATVTVAATTEEGSLCSPTPVSFSVTLGTKSSGIQYLDPWGV